MLATKTMLFGVMVALSLGTIGCEHQRMDTCPDFAKNSPYYIPTSGKFVVNYDGFAGVFSKAEFDMFVFNEGPDGVHFKGCRDDGDYVWIELGIMVPQSSRGPMAFDAEETDSAKASAFVERYPDGDSSRRRIAEFGRLPQKSVGLEGTLYEFRPGIMKAQVTMRDLREGTRETGDLNLDIDLHWQSRVSQ